MSCFNQNSFKLAKLWSELIPLELPLSPVEKVDNHIQVRGFEFLLNVIQVYWDIDDLEYDNYYGWQCAEAIGGQTELSRLHEYH